MIFQLKGQNKEQKGVDSMESIDTRGMKAAELTEEQFLQLRRMEQDLNDAAGNKGEIFLLAVTRP